VEVANLLGFRGSTRHFLFLAAVELVAALVAVEQARLYALALQHAEAARVSWSEVDTEAVMRIALVVNSPSELQRENNCFFCRLRTGDGRNTYIRHGWDPSSHDDILRQGLPVYSSSRATVTEYDKEAVIVDEVNAIDLDRTRVREEWLLLSGLRIEVEYPYLRTVPQEVLYTVTLAFVDAVKAKVFDSNLGLLVDHYDGTWETR
jgi:hypothetical protein